MLHALLYASIPQVHCYTLVNLLMSSTSAVYHTCIYPMCHAIGRRISKGEHQGMHPVGCGEKKVVALSHRLLQLAFVKTEVMLTGLQNPAYAGDMPSTA